MNWDLFKEMLSIDSTSGREREMADWLLKHLEAPKKESFEVGDGTLNLLFSWGRPKVVFCTHMDTVPPYIAPVFPEDTPSGGTQSLRSFGPSQGTVPCGHWLRAPRPYTRAGVHMPPAPCVSPSVPKPTVQFPLSPSSLSLRP